MEIQLKRAFTPAEIGEEEACGICALPFVAETVSARALTDDIYPVRPSCVEYLGRRNPGRFPTIEELEEANRLCTEPVYASEEAAMRLKKTRDPSVHDAYEKSWLARA